MNTCFSRLFLSVGVLLASTATFAADGVIEINQSRAFAGGVSASDGPGYPVTIDASASGSYRLTGNLTVVTAAGGIEVLADNATIDLNGFEIICLLTCITAATHGIDGTTLTVTDGSVTNFGGMGVHASAYSRIEGVTAYSNGADGIVTAHGSIVIDSVARQNGGDGIRMGDGSLAEGNHVVQNDGRGLVAGAGSILNGNVSRINGDMGIVAAEGSLIVDNNSAGNTVGILATRSLIRDNSSQDNTGHGISLEPSGSRNSLIIANVSRGNGGSGLNDTFVSLIRDNIFCANVGDGINYGFADYTFGNTACNNGGIGMILGPDSNAHGRYRGNLIFGNTGGTVINASNKGQNSCNGASSCP